MAWQLSGQLIEACSCKSACPCALGPAEPDQGWCSGALTFAIDKGQTDGVDLSSRVVVWAIDLPKDFASGNGTVCIIIDDGADARQHQELDAIFSGKKGGPGVVLGSFAPRGLPTESGAINLPGGENQDLTVGTMGKVKLKPIKDQAGKTATLMNAPIFGLVEISEVRLSR